MNGRTTFRHGRSIGCFAAALSAVLAWTAISCANYFRLMWAAHIARVGVVGADRCSDGTPEFYARLTSITFPPEWLGERATEYWTQMGAWSITQGIGLQQSATILLWMLAFVCLVESVRWLRVNREMSHGNIRHTRWLQVSADRIRTRALCVATTVTLPVAAVAWMLSAQRDWSGGDYLAPGMTIAQAVIAWLSMAGVYLLSSEFRSVRLRRVTLRAMGQCVRCGYPVPASVPTCSECGLSTHDGDRVRRKGAGLSSVVGAIGLALVVVTWVIFPPGTRWGNWKRLIPAEDPVELAVCRVPFAEPFQVRFDQMAWKVDVPQAFPLSVEDLCNVQIATGFETQVPIIGLRGGQREASHQLARLHATSPVPGLVVLVVWLPEGHVRGHVTISPDGQHLHQPISWHSKGARCLWKVAAWEQ